MSITTSQQISGYYDQFGRIDVTFTKEVIRAVALFPRQVFLKCLGQQWPCVVYSSSMVGAKVIVNMNSALNERIKQANNLVSLRLSFLQRDKADPLSFYVSSRVAGASPYGENNPELNFLSLQYTTRPPDALIEILGELIDANANARNRKEERVIITTDSARKMALTGKEQSVVIEGIPRRCIVRDLSFSGAKIIIFGVAKFIVNKEAVLRLDLDEGKVSLGIGGTIVRFETVEGRNDIAAFALKFHEESVPMNYKMMINDYLRTAKFKISEEKPDPPPGPDPITGRDDR